jgi:hypothetical protein
MTKTFGGPTHIPIVGDWDGDGISDLDLYEPSTGNWNVIFSAEGFSRTITRNWGGSPDQVALPKAP